MRICSDDDQSLLQDNFSDCLSTVKSFQVGNGIYDLDDTNVNEALVASDLSEADLATEEGNFRFDQVYMPGKYQQYNLSYFSLIMEQAVIMV